MTPCECRNSVSTEKRTQRCILRAWSCVSSPDVFRICSAIHIVKRKTETAPRKKWLQCFLSKRIQEGHSMWLQFPMEAPHPPQTPHQAFKEGAWKCNKRASWQCPNSPICNLLDKGRHGQDSYTKTRLSLRSEQTSAHIIWSMEQFEIQF